MYQNTNFIVNFLTPLRQALFAIFFGLIGMALAKIFSAPNYFCVVLSFVSIVFFSLVNNILSIFQTSFKQYTLPSWGAYASIVIVVLMMARLISGDSIQKHPEFLKILFSVSLFYIVLSVLMRVIRAMWEFAENDEN
jgi:hypothetical protein